MTLLSIDAIGKKAHGVGKTNSMIVQKSSPTRLISQESRKRKSQLLVICNPPQTMFT